MKFLCWNIRGLNDPLKQKEVQKVASTAMWIYLVLLKIK